MRPPNDPTPLRASVIWRRLDQPGHDSALLTEGATGAVIQGTAVFRELSRTCRLDYRIVCDAEWRTVSARLGGWIETLPIDMTIAVDASRRWTLNGHAQHDLHGCDDIDLSFSPSTNLLPIRRARLVVGARMSVRAGWLRCTGDVAGAARSAIRAGVRVPVTGTKADRSSAHWKPMGRAWSPCIPVFGRSRKVARAESCKCLEC